MKPIADAPGAMSVTRRRALWLVAGSAASGLAMAQIVSASVHALGQSRTDLNRRTPPADGFAQPGREAPIVRRVPAESDDARIGFWSYDESVRRWRLDSPDRLAQGPDMPEGAAPVSRQPQAETSPSAGTDPDAGPAVIDRARARAAIDRRVELNRLVNIEPDLRAGLELMTGSSGEPRDRFARAIAHLRKAALQSPDALVLTVGAGRAWVSADRDRAQRVRFAMDVAAAPPRGSLSATDAQFARAVWSSLAGDRAGALVSIRAALSGGDERSSTRALAEALVDAEAAGR
jgi:hypothetical protein